jgi:hypothetical protein
MRGWVGPVLALAMTGWLAACASAPPPPSTASASALPQQRAALVRAAMEEWARWGRLTVDGWPEALPQPAAAENYSNVLAYWEAVPEGPAVIQRHQRTYDALMAGLTEAQPVGMQPAETLSVPLPSISLWAYPAWSAAFVSYAMQRAGVPGYVFPPSAAHAFYIDALLAAYAGHPEGAAFRPHDPGEYTPAPGDLICADRSRSPLYHWQERAVEPGQFRPMHCDIVVASGGGLVQAIGGNVLDAVVLRRFPADRSGHALPPPADKPPFFVVFENRLDVTR